MKTIRLSSGASREQKPEGLLKDVRTSREKDLCLRNPVRVTRRIAKLRLECATKGGFRAIARAMGDLGHFKGACAQQVGGDRQAPPRQIAQRRYSDHRREAI